MTNYYFDPIGGNDANDGSTTALAKKTLGAFAGSYAVGDEFRCKKTPDPYSVGSNQWYGVETYKDEIRKNIVSSTNATPIVVTVTGHGYSNGDLVSIVSHSTNTNANGFYQIANVAQNTFELVDSKGNGVGGATGTVIRCNYMGVKFGTPRWKVIENGNLVWSGGTGVTCSKVVNGAMDALSRFVTTSAVTTARILGVIALPATLNLSSYEMIGFRYNGPVIASGDLVIDLCSDTAGTTIVNTITIPAVTVASRYHKFVVDTGGTLGASIQSIAVRSTVSFASKDFYLQGITAFLPYDDANCVTYDHTIYKTNDLLSESVVHGFVGDYVFHYGYYFLTRSAMRGYAGSSESTDTSVRQALFISDATTTYTVGINAGTWGGTTANPIKVRCGWNFTTDAQDGYSAYGNRSGFGRVFYVNRAYVLLERLIGIGAVNSEITLGNYDGMTLDDCKVFGGNNGLDFNGNNTTGKIRFTTRFVANGNSVGLAIGVATSNVDFECDTSLEGGTYGLYTGLGGHMRWNFTENLFVRNCTTSGLYLAQACNWKFNKDVYIGFTGSHAVYLATCGFWRFKGTIDSRYSSYNVGDISGKAINSIYSLAVIGCSDIHIANYVRLSHGTRGEYYSGSDQIFIYSGSGSGASVSSTYFQIPSRVYYSNFTFGESVKLGWAYGFGGGYLYSERENEVDNNNKIYTENGIIQPDTNIIYNSSLYSNKISPLSSIYIDDVDYIKLKLGEFYCKANEEKKISVYARRSANTITGNLFVRNKQLEGMDADYTDTFSTTLPYSRVMYAGLNNNLSLPIGDVPFSVLGGTEQYADFGTEKAFDFNGSTLIRALSSRAESTIEAGEYSVSFWMTANPNGVFQIVTGRGKDIGATSSSNFFIYLSTTNVLRMRVFNSSGTDYNATVNVGSFPSDGTFFHVVGTFSASNNRVRIYVNKSLIQSTATTGVMRDLASTYGIAIGGGQELGSSYYRYTGKVARYSLYAKELTQAEIDAIYDEGLKTAEGWEKLEVAFTPTESGVVNADMQVYGGSLDSVWVDNIQGDTNSVVYHGEPYIFSSLRRQISYGWMG